MKDLVERKIIGIDYDFSSSSNYLIINIPNGKDVVNYQMQMITSNKTDYFLNVRKLQVNTKIQLYYDLGNKATLSQLIKNEKLSKDEYLKLILNILKALEEAEEFELELKGVLLDRRFIYMENLNSKPSFVYLPFYKENDNFQNLIDFLENLKLESRIEDGNDIYVTPIINACKNEYTTIADLKILISNLKEVDEEDEDSDYFEQPNNQNQRKNNSSAKGNQNDNFQDSEMNDGNPRTSSNEKKQKPVKKKREVPITKEETKKFLEELYDDEDKESIENIPGNKEAFSDADMFDIFGNATDGIKNEFSNSDSQESFLGNNSPNKSEDMFGQNDYDNYFTKNQNTNEDFAEFGDKPGSTFEAFDNKNNFERNDFETEFIDFEKDFVGEQKTEKENYEDFLRNKNQKPFNGNNNENMYGGYDYEYKEADQYVKQNDKMKSEDLFSQREEKPPKKESFFSKLFSKNKAEEEKHDYFEQEPVRKQNPNMQQERKIEKDYDGADQEKIPGLYIFIIAVIEIILIAIIGVLTVKGVFTDSNSTLPINIASTGITVILFVVIQYIIFKKFLNALKLKPEKSFEDEYREIPKAPTKPQREKQEENKKSSIFSMFGSKNEKPKQEESNHFENNQNIRQGKEIKSRDAHEFRKGNIEQREAFDSINETPIQRNFGEINRNQMQNNQSQDFGGDLFADFGNNNNPFENKDPFLSAEHSFGGLRNNPDESDEFEKYEPVSLNKNRSNNFGKQEEVINMSGKRESERETARETARELQREPEREPQREPEREPEREHLNRPVRMSGEQTERENPNKPIRTSRELPERENPNKPMRTSRELPERMLQNQKMPVETNTERMPANILPEELDNVKIEDTVYLNNKKLPYLTVEVDGAVQKIYITKPSFIIGRYIGKVDYVCHSNKVGKIHAEIIARDGLYFINDFNSKNGTYINSYRQRIISNIDYPIDNEDVIILADVEFTFYEK